MGKGKWKKGTGFFKGQKFRKNPDGTEDIKYKDNGKEIREQSLKDCQFFITEDNLEIFVEETWNEVWGKFNEQ